MKVNCWMQFRFVQPTVDRPKTQPNFSSTISLLHTVIDFYMIKPYKIGIQNIVGV